MLTVEEKKKISFRTSSLTLVDPKEEHLLTRISSKRILQREVQSKCTPGKEMPQIWQSIASHNKSFSIVSYAQLNMNHLPQYKVTSQPARTGYCAHSTRSTRSEIHIQ